MHYSSQETINQILSLRKEGKTYLEIQKLTGCCAKTISKYCIEAGLSENPKKVQITPELIEEIQRRYNEIGNLKEVAKEYHVAATTLRKHGLQVKNGKSTGLYNFIIQIPIKKILESLEEPSLLKR